MAHGEGTEIDGEGRRVAGRAGGMRIIRCHCRLAGYTEKHRFLFQLGETLNPELQIITSVFSKVIHRGEY